MVSTEQLFCFERFKAWQSGDIEKDVPSTALVEAQHKGGQREADESQRAGVGRLAESRVEDLRDGALILRADIVSRVVVMPIGRGNPFSVGRRGTCSRHVGGHDGTMAKQSRPGYK